MCLYIDATRFASVHVFSCWFKFSFLCLGSFEFISSFVWQFEFSMLFRSVMIMLSFLLELMFVSELGFGLYVDHPTLVFFFLPCWFILRLWLFGAVQWEYLWEFSWTELQI